MSKLEGLNWFHNSQMALLPNVKQRMRLVMIESCGNDRNRNWRNQIGANWGWKPVCKLAKCFILTAHQTHAKGLV